MADKIGLEDGEAYPFDFFYMERHGTAANFGIETNIQLVESAMTTTKTGYQYGTSTGYNGYVDPNEKVAYSFSLQNNGNAPIYNLTFDDPAIGVYFGHDKVEVNKKGNYTDIEKEMYLYRFGTDGKPTLTIPAGSLTAEKIIAELKKPLPVGETIAIYGFKYKISNEEWETGDDNFNNIVYTTATVNESLTSEQLHGKADWNVQKAPLSYEPFHVYDWVRKSAKDKEWGQRPDGVLELTENELRQYFVKGLDLKGNVLEDFNQKELEFVLCNASGNEDSLSKNTCAEMDNENDKIIYRSDKPGKETVFFKMKGSGLGTNNLYDNFVFSFDVYTYGVMDNVYVLDYGLEVELNCDKYGFQVNDHLSIAENMYNPATTIRIQTGTEEQKFGDYVFNADKAEDAADKAILDETYDSVKRILTM